MSQEEKKSDSQDKSPKTKSYSPLPIAPAISFLSLTIGAGLTLAYIFLEEEVNGKEITNLLNLETDGKAVFDDKIMKDADGNSVEDAYEISGIVARAEKGDPDASAELFKNELFRTQLGNISEPRERVALFKYLEEKKITLPKQFREEVVNYENAEKKGTIAEEFEYVIPPAQEGQESPLSFIDIDGNGSLSAQEVSKIADIVKARQDAVALVNAQKGADENMKHLMELNKAIELREAIEQYDALVAVAQGTRADTTGLTDGGTEDATIAELNALIAEINSLTPTGVDPIQLEIESATQFSVAAGATTDLKSGIANPATAPQYRPNGGTAGTDEVNFDTVLLRAANSGHLELESDGTLILGDIKVTFTDSDTDGSYDGVAFASATDADAVASTRGYLAGTPLAPTTDGYDHMLFAMQGQYIDYAQRAADSVKGFEEGTGVTVGGVTYPGIDTDELSEAEQEMLKQIRRDGVETARAAEPPYDGKITDAEVKEIATMFENGAWDSYEQTVSFKLPLGAVDSGEQTITVSTTLSELAEKGFSGATFTVSSTATDGSVTGATGKWDAIITSDILGEATVPAEGGDEKALALKTAFQRAFTTKMGGFTNKEQGQVIDELSADITKTNEELRTQDSTFFDEPENWLVVGVAACLGVFLYSIGHQLYTSNKRERISEAADKDQTPDKDNKPMPEEKNYGAPSTTTYPDTLGGNDAQGAGGGAIIANLKGVNGTLGTDTVAVSTTAGGSRAVQGANR